MRFLSALLLLVLLGGAALAWDVQGTLPAAQARCPPTAAAAYPVVADIYAFPESERIELTFQLFNPGPDNLTYRPSSWSVAYYEVRSLGRLAPLFHRGIDTDFAAGFDGYQVSPGQHGWIGGDSFEPPRGAPVTREYLAIVVTGDSCGEFRFSRATVPSV